MAASAKRSIVSEASSRAVLDSTEPDAVVCQVCRSVSVSNH